MPDKVYYIKLSHASIVEALTTERLRKAEN